LFFQQFTSNSSSDKSRILNGKVLSTSTIKLLIETEGDKDKDEDEDEDEEPRTLRVLLALPCLINADDADDDDGGE
jgi:hypothetical protein